MREKWPIYRRRLYFILLALAFVLGVHGLYVYYRPIIERDWQLISAMLYGTMKLFLFAPPLGVTAEVSLSYEIAKWLAPILTSALVLTALTNRVLHLKNVIRNLFGKHLIIFGVSDQSKAFLRSLKASGSPYRKTIVSLEPLSDDAKHELELLGAAVYVSNVRQLQAKEREVFANSIRLSRSEHILFMSDDETVNYQALLSLLAFMQPKSLQKLHVQLSTPVLRRYVEQAIERQKAEQDRYQRLDLRTYNIAELTMEKLLGGGRSVRFVKPLLDQMEPGKDYLSHLPPVQLFVLGFNELTKALILRSANDFVITRQKIKLTIVDDVSASEWERFRYQYPELERAVELELHTSLPGHPGFFTISRQDYTALFLNHPNPLVNLQALEYFRADLPVAFRNTTKLDLSESYKTHPQIIFYGDLSEIMTAEIVLQESLDQAAREFNQRYAEVAAVLGSGGQPWSELSATKKQSSKLSAAHAAMKRALLESDLGMPSQEVAAQIKADLVQFNQLVEAKRGSEFQVGLKAFFREKPYLERLSELEHLRWCYSYYMLGFRYGPERDEVNKTHPCIIESWDELMGPAFFQCHPEYDLISGLSLYGEKYESEGL